MDNRLAIVLISLMSLWITDAHSKKIPCHSECRCSQTGENLDVSCQRGGLNDRTLHSLLNKLPKQATSLRIVGPWFMPNNFSITLEILRFKQLRELHLVNCGLRSLGKRVFSNLRSLRTLNVEKNKITSVSAETFERTGQIESLNLAENHLRFGLLPTGAFSYLKRLKSLSISGNRISQFPRNLLLGLRNLQSLNMDGNYLNHSGLSQLLSDVPQLSKLSINDCGIHDLSPDTFESVSNLQHLEFGLNRFGRIPILPMKKLQALNSISLAGNNISIVPPFAFQGLSQLTKISLAHNTLGSCYNLPTKEAKHSKYGIDPLAFYNLTVTELDLSYNHYSSFHSTQLGLARNSVQILHLSGNPLGKILPKQIFGLNLKALHIADIGLRSFPTRMPPEYSHLNLLNVSGNQQLETVPPTPASSLSKHLKELDISNCNFSYLPKYFYRLILNRIKTVYLQENPFDCRCHILALKSFLLHHKQRERCAELRMSQIRCSSPGSLKDKLVVKVDKPPDCSIIFGASSGLSQQSEIGILIATVCGILLLVALITALVCWSRTWGRKGTYRTREDSKGHLSPSGSDVSSGQSSPPPVEPSAERLF